MSSSAISRRSVLTSAGFLAGAVALSACGNSATTASKTPVKAKGGTLTIMCVQGEITDAEVAAFEAAHPGVKIKLINTDVTRLNAMLAAGNPPDVVRDAGTDVTPYIASRGVALNLDEYFAQSTVLKEADILPINDVWKWDGTTQGKGSRYGIAKDWSQDAMWWYNADMWSAAGLKAPDPSRPISYDELADAAKKLTRTEGGKTSVHGLFTTTASMNRIGSMVASAGGRILSADLATADFTSPEAIAALTWLVDVAKSKIGYSLVNPGPDWDGPQYVAGKQATSGQGFWFGGFLGSTAKEYQSKSVFAAAPTLGKKRVSPSFGAVGYWIPAKSKNAGAAFQFLEWYCGGAGAQKRIAAGNGLPSLKSMLSLVPQSTAFEKASFKVQSDELHYVDVLHNATPYAQTTALDTTLAKTFTATVGSGASVAKLADQLTKDVNAVLASGKKLVGK
ncbi:ABC transporter substrate-binding protein [Streptomyces turgidiscabies]|uniref:Multiple sugar transport system substrate-binding protein n=1 Tax=Streptomyces turgidiscabies TaxID=85558 RepID=A0ABU0RNR0_9ACTN|nr:extracellular solute-binding protein [Streptomyces turgidiscabies]MDQ0933627.1 multiple sugar transport system substrate-binding protein [Streptomyces turgidiscabies]